MTTPLETIATPPAQRSEEFKRRVLPLLVWSLAALAATLLMVGRARRLEYIGLAQSLDYRISARATGTVQAVLVDLYDAVDKGEVVAKLDDRPVLASIATADATVRQLQAQLGAATAQLSADRRTGRESWVADLRRFQVNEEQRRLELLALKVQIESDAVEVERLAIEAEREQALLAAGLASKTDAEAARLTRDAVRRRLDENRVLYAQTEQELKTAENRRNVFERNLPEPPPVEPLLRPLQASIEVETQRLKQIEVEREATVLRSPVAGQVSQILCREGQAVVPGEPVVLVSEHDVHEIVAYLRESDRRHVQVGSAVVVTSLSDPARSAESVVMRVGGTVAQLPPRLWSNPALPEYGRALVVAETPSLGLMPGELVSVRLRD
ncbi:MAG TPA: HlyD family efflux transporter periplasmic adaptor subunit [Candidatus Polarisedimenticolaceae bacterium]|nr:HlyD family efflux transporter periplasmic adaptor subunit [Candidatus Polarisedimenticolaceae bacterium]